MMTKEMEREWMLGLPSSGRRAIPPARARLCSRPCPGCPASLLGRGIDSHGGRGQHLGILYCSERTGGSIFEILLVDKGEIISQGSVDTADGAAELT